MKIIKENLNVNNLLKEIELFNVELFNEDNTYYVFLSMEGFTSLIENDPLFRDTVFLNFSNEMSAKNSLGIGKEFKYQNIKFIQTRKGTFDDMEGNFSELITVIGVGHDVITHSISFMWESI